MVESNRQVSAKAFISTAGLALALSVIACTTSENPPGAVPANPNAAQVNPADGGLKLAREWLKLNLNSGEWEEVQFWPAVPMTKLHDSNIKDERAAVALLDDEIAMHKQSIDDIARTGVARPEWISDDEPPLSASQIELEWFRIQRRLWSAERKHKKALEAVTATERDGPPILCRLRYRTTNQFGAKVLTDRYFCIKDDAIYNGPGFPDESWQITLGYWWSSEFSDGLKNGDFGKDVAEGFIRPE